MKKALFVAFILLVAVGLTGCPGTTIRVKNMQTNHVKMTDALDELYAQYGTPTVHYRGVKLADGENVVIKDLYFVSADGKTTVVVTVVNDAVSEIITYTSEGTKPHKRRMHHRNRH
jgi:hypothetical protein